LVTRDVTGATPVVVPPIVVLDEVDSTNAEARRLAEAGEAGPVWIVGAAARPPAAVGVAASGTQAVATWPQPFFCGPTKPAGEAAQISFIAALAVADMLDRYVPESLIR
jgi:BirA family transcriptional regulator, biotin operon repressor / biotin---[acetyl-CoA-carboxylase] ligase